MAMSNTEEVACVAAVELALAPMLFDHTMLLVVDVTLANQMTVKLLVTRRSLSGKVIDVSKTLVEQSNAKPVLDSMKDVNIFVRVLGTRAVVCTEVAVLKSGLTQPKLPLRALFRVSLLFALPYWIQRRDCRSVQACWRIDCRNSSNVTMVCDSTI